MEIKSVKVLDKTVEGTYVTNKNGVPFNGTFLSKETPHPDLRDALNAFIYPFLFNLNIKRDASNNDSAKVTGISLKESANQDFIFITGAFARNDGTMVGTSTSMIASEDEEYDEWPLENMIVKLLSEVEKYFTGEKKAQAQMDFPEE